MPKPWGDAAAWGPCREGTGRDPQTSPSSHPRILCQASHRLHSAGSQSPRSSLATTHPPRGPGQGRGDGPGEAKRLSTASRAGGPAGTSLTQKKNDQSRCQVAWYGVSYPDPLYWLCPQPWRPRVLAASSSQRPSCAGMLVAGWEPPRLGSRAPTHTQDLVPSTMLLTLHTPLRPRPGSVPPLSSPTESTLPAKHFLEGSHSDFASRKLDLRYPHHFLAA